MKVKPVLVLFCIACAALCTPGCKSTKGHRSQKAQYKDIYVDQFRLTYFRQLLLKSYNQSAAAKEIILKDHSGFTESILTREDYHLIDSLTTVDNQTLIADSIQGRRRAEGAQGKRPLGFMLDKVRSKWIEKLARRRYKRSGL